MTTTRASVLAALVAALGLTAMSPAFAAGPDNQPRAGKGGPMMEFRRDAPGGIFQFAAFSCGPRAADRLDNRLDRIVGRLDLTADQKKLFDDFRTSALTAQTSFADQCDTIRPDRADRATRAERPDLIQRMEQQLKVDEARVAAMSELLPQFKSFYESLTDQQKKQLMPRRGFMMQGMEMPGKGMPQRPGMPPADAPAPGDDLDG